MRTRISRRDLLRTAGWCAVAVGRLKAAPMLAARAPAAPTSPVMTTLSTYMAAAKDRPLPAEVIEKARHHILDTFAAMVYGSTLPLGQGAIALARPDAGRSQTSIVRP